MEMEWKPVMIINIHTYHVVPYDPVLDQAPTPEDFSIYNNTGYEVYLTRGLIPRPSRMQISRGPVGSTQLDL